MVNSEVQQSQIYYDTVGKWLDRCLIFFKRIVDKHARPLALINNDGSPEMLLNDFVYYCITKSCKSLQAIILLINSGFPEDAIILLRSIYENYLSVAYAIQNPESVRDFIYKRIGLSVGHLEHPINKKGRPDKRKLVNKKSGECFDFELTIGELARGTGNVSDTELYNAFYPYLCEHVHSNMIGSGNYRNDSSSKYSISETDNILAARYYTLLVMALFCQELLCYPRTPEKIKVSAISLSSKAIPLLLFGTDSLDFSTVKEIQIAIPKRLSSFVTLI